MKELSYGQQRVGLTENSSINSKSDIVKSLCAAVIDELHEIPDSVLIDGETLAIAIKKNEVEALCRKICNLTDSVEFNGENWVRKVLMK